MTTKEYKIIGVGKGTRITYTSFNEAKEAVVKNKILPRINNDVVIIEELIKNTYKVKVEVPTLSNENRKFLIDYVLKKLTVDNITSGPGLALSNPVWLLISSNIWHPEFYKLMYTRCIDKYKITQKEIDEACDKTKYNYCSESPLAIRLSKYDTKQDWFECIKKFLETIDVNEIKFICNVTDYKPCHNITIEIEFMNKHNSVSSFNLQIRQNDFPFNQGYCYGRNTKLRSQEYLTDENFEKWCKDLNIK